MNALQTHAQIKLNKEECALGMEQRSNDADAPIKDAQILLRKEECARKDIMQN
jgi:hypothetical protein